MHIKGCCCCCLVASVVSDSVRPQRWQPTRFSHPWDSPGKNTGVGCHFLLQCMKVKSESEVTQLCPTPSDPMDYSPPGFSIHGIFQARVLEWGAIAFPEWYMQVGAIYGQWEVRQGLLGGFWKRCTHSKETAKNRDNFFSFLSHGDRMWHLELLQPCCYQRRQQPEDFENVKAEKWKELMRSRWWAHQIHLIFFLGTKETIVNSLPWI